ncbi:MFS transporter [Microbacterium sp. X-17]|uniref:MFS transporter n=1 Tax=Microbacterium sp. X-17 TaxID=3144404 RepID=UPI0031F4D692
MAVERLPKPAGAATGTRRHWVLVTAVLALAATTASSMQGIVLPIQSDLPALLDASREQTAWVVTATLLTSCVAGPIAGRLGDLFGKRRIAVALLLVLVVGSIVAALAQDVTTLIVGRALQGIAYGLTPLGFAMVGEIVPARRVPTSLAVISGGLAFGWAISLPLGALITQLFDWRWLFWMAVLVGLVDLLLVLAVVPAGRIRASGTVDVIGAVGLTAGITGVLLAVSQIGTWNGWWIAGCAAAGAVILVVWARYQWRASSPLVDLRTTLRRVVLLTNLSTVAAGFAYYACTISLPQLLELPATDGGAGLGLPLLGAGLVLAIGAVGEVAAAPLAAVFGTRFGGRPLMIAGALVMLAGYVLVLFLHTEVWHILVVGLVLGLGIGLSFAGMPMIIGRAVPVTETASANSVNALARTLGTTSASTVIAVILTTGIVQGGPAAGQPSPGAFLLSFALPAVVAAASAVLSLLAVRRPA